MTRLFVFLTERGGGNDDDRIYAETITEAFFDNHGVRGVLLANTARDLASQVFWEARDASDAPNAFDRDYFNEEFLSEIHKCVLRYIDEHELEIRSLYKSGDSARHSRIRRRRVRDTSHFEDFYEDFPKEKLEELSERISQLSSYLVNDLSNELFDEQGDDAYDAIEDLRYWGNDLYQATHCLNSFISEYYD